MLQQLNNSQNLIDSLKFWEVKRKELQTVAQSVPSFKNLYNVDLATEQFSYYWKALGIVNYSQWSVIKKVW